MDSLALASTFMGILSLLYSYQSSNDFADLEGFIQWLYTAQQDDTARLIEQNDNIKVQLSSLMKGNHTEVISKLEQLNNLMLSIASRVEGLKELADSFQVHPELSDQAINILIELVESNGEYIWITSYTDGIEYTIDMKIELEIKEPRFIEDDLDVMMNLGLITLVLSDSYERKYRVTRQAVKLVDMIVGSP